ncbi:gluconate permease [Klebsiella pneumoniae]|uniref:Gluconate permease n=1 Tax=Klebsiella pneumoniae TaxID=573 RepID=A0A2X3EKU3_KLEPN|nr:gluconate permease [Klebsiella pneumoniae]
MLIVSGTLCQALLLPEKRGSPADDRHWYPAGRPADLPGPGQLTLGIRRRMSLKKLGEVTGSAIPSSADVILVAGAGGAFGGVLVASGIGNALAEALETIHLPLMPRRFSAIAGAQSLAGFGHRGDPHHLRSAVAGGCRSGAAATGAGDAGDLLRLAPGCRTSTTPDSGSSRAISDSRCRMDSKTWTVLTTIMGVTGFLITLAAVVCALMLTWVAPATLTSPRRRP